MESRQTRNDRVIVETQCTTCALRGRGWPPPAVWVASNADGLMWYECNEHGPHDHPEGPRVKRIPLQVLRGHLARPPWLRDKFNRAHAALKQLKGG